MSLHVPSFGGGVVKLGAPSTQRTDELLTADSFDIGARGQLICTTDVSDYVVVNDAFGRQLLDVYAIADVVVGGGPELLVLGRGRDATNTLNRYVHARFARSGAASPVAGVSFAGFAVVAPPTQGVQVTTLQFPGLFTVNATPSSLMLVCTGAREGYYPKTARGLIVYAYDPATTNVTLYTMDQLDALGTGPQGATFPGGTKAVQLYPRGIVGYNNHVFAYGFDNADATNGDGPARVMFCNSGDPRKWGNDNQATAGDRFFTDSDAIVLGDVGEIIRGALKWKGRLYFGSNQQLHYIGGYERNSYLTDGANPVAKSYNIVGPHALIEGPDSLLYQVSDQGLVAYDGASFEPHFKRLVDDSGHSKDWWDLIWMDPTAAVGYPGRTNQDLVWTEVDWDREQVIIGIPFCNAGAGAGAGNDTVIIRFHTRTGGFTRQVFTGVAFTASAYLRREGQQREVRMLGTGTAGKFSIQRYGYQATPTTSPILPTALPDVKFGPYAPFGEDGDGVWRRAYLTLAWESAASLPLVFTISTTIDDAANDSFKLSVQNAAPGAPADGDVWVDTSQTDANLGNATAGVLVGAAGGFLVKMWSAGRAVWQLVPGSGEKGTRGRIPLPLTRRNGSLVTLRALCTSAAGRFEVIGLGINPGGGKPNA